MGTADTAGPDDSCHRSAMKRSVLLLALGLAGAIDGPLEALDPAKDIRQYGHRSWTVEDGLPQSSVLDIAQTPDGYLWLATRGGLVRWDGVRFKVFDRRNTEHLASSFISALAVDHEGTLWIGSDDGLFSHRDGTFQRWDRRLGLEHSRILALAPGRAGGIWIGTYGGGLGRLRDDQLRIWTTADGLPDNSIWELLEDSAGVLWYAPSAGGLELLEDGEFVHHELGEGFREVGIWAFLEDRRGNLWIGGNNGLHRRRQESIRTVDAGTDLASPYVTTLLEDRDGNLWVGTGEGGLHRLRIDATGKFRIQHFGVDDGLLSNDVAVLFEDREGNLWIGTQSGGLDVLKDGLFSFLRLSGRQADDFWATSAYQDAEGTIWVATRANGLLAVRPDGGIDRLTTIDGLPTNRLWCVLGDRRSNLWIGTSGRGLVRLRDGEIRNFTSAQGLPNDVVFGLHEGRDGTLWIATNGGLGRLRGEELDGLTVDDGLSSNLIRALHEDRLGNLWIGTSGGGLNRLRDGEFSRFGPEQGLEGGHVWSLHEDARGVLWIGTSAGLFRWQDGRIVGVKAHHGLPDDSVNMIATDDAGDLWLGTWRGIQRVRRRQLEEFFAGRRDSVLSLGYGRGDGVRNAECHGGIQPAVWKSRDGRLWFPTTRGLAVVEPSVVAEPPASPRAVIEGLDFDGTAAGLEERVVVPPTVRRLEIRYTSLSFRAPERLRFRYRLEGFDHGWIDAGSSRWASYTNVSPGEYKFQVAARNEDGDWGSETELRLRVLPRFYETPAFAALIVILAVAGGVGIHRLRVGRFKRRERKLRELYRALEARNAELARFNYTVAHDLRNPLTTISNFLGLVRRDALAGRTEEVRQGLDHLDAAAKTMRRLLEELFEISRVGLRSNPPETVAIGELVREALAELAGPIAERGIEVEIAPDLPAVYGDRERLLELMRHLLENAVNYLGDQPQPRIEVGARDQGPEPVFYVRDNGQGIDARYHEKIFGLFERLNPGDSETTGIGLTLVKRIVEVHGGRVWVESEGRGRGSTFCFTLPKGPVGSAPAS